MTSVVFPLAQGVSIGTGITELKRIEDSFRAGRGALMTAVTQSGAFHYTSMLGGGALRAGGCDEMPVGVKAVGYLAPPILAFFIKRGISNGTLRECAVFVQDNLGLLCQVASTVAAVALIAFGHLALGITSLAIIGIGFLDRLGILPACIRRPLHRYSPIARIGTGVIIGDLMEKFFALLSLGTYLYEAAFRRKKPPPNRPKDQLTIPLLKQILSGQITLKVNPSPISPDRPSSPKMDKALLLTLFDGVNWKAHMTTVRAKLLADIRFKELHGTLDRWRKQVRNDLKTYISKKDPRLQYYLEQITIELLKVESEIHFVDGLLRLAIDGGSYCDATKLHVAEQVYAGLLMGNNQTPVDIKIQLRLQEARTLWFHQKYATTFILPNKQRSWVTKLLKKCFDFQDLNIYNLFAHLHKNPIKLSQSTEENEHAVMMDPLTKSGVKYLMENVESSFKKVHTADFIIDAIQEGVNNGTLPTSQIYSWWTCWINSQPITAEEKTQLIKDLTINNVLLGFPTQENPNLLKAMALSLGHLVA